MNGHCQLINYGLDSLLLNYFIITAVLY